MPGFNPFVVDDGDFPDIDYGPQIVDPLSGYGVRDGTEIIVAVVVLVALGILFGFFQAGFRSVITVGR